METSHFWVGRFLDEKRVDDYFEEVYDENDEAPISPFARDQGEKWYDHDFMEHGFREDAASVEELVTGHSYYEQWAAELARRVVEAGLTGMNTLVFINRDQIERPRSVQGEGYWLHYLGTISYSI